MIHPQTRLTTILTQHHPHPTVVSASLSAATSCKLPSLSLLDGFTAFSRHFLGTRLAFEDFRVPRSVTVSAQHCTSWGAARCRFAIRSTYWEPTMSTRKKLLITFSLVAASAISAIAVALTASLVMLNVVSDVIGSLK